MATLPTIASNLSVGISPTVVVGNANSSFWLFNPDQGYDLTHPASPDGPVVYPRLKLQTTTAPITIAPEKTALVVIDMQNLFLSPALFGKVRGEGHDAEDVLLNLGLPAARKAGIQIVHATWGISDEQLAVLPPVISRIFGFFEEDHEVDNVPAGARESQSSGGVGDDMGDVELPDGSTVAAGRMLMRGAWNAALHDPLKKDFDASQGTARPDVRFHKDRLSGFWGGSTPCVEYLKDKGITTLLFTGVNTDQCVLASLQDACNLGFDTILLKDGCGTSSPAYATKMVDYNCRKSWGFVSSCQSLSDGAESMKTI